MSALVPNAGVGSRNTGSQTALRELNLNRIVEELQYAGPQTQVALARATGLAPGTVSNIVSVLRKEGRVATRSVSAGGRRALEVSLIADGRLAIGIDIGRTHLQVVASDIGHNMVASPEVRLELGHRPETTFATANQVLDELLANNGMDRARVQVCGISLPSSLTPVTKEVVQPTVLPSWSGVHLADAAFQAFGVPAVLGHDASLGALANSLYGPDRDVHSLIYVKVASGIGLGLAIDQQMYYSSYGLSGEIGHAPAGERATLCYCGRRGCLETIASARSVLEAYRVVYRSPGAVIEDVIASAELGDQATLRLLEEAGTAVGETMALVCNMLGPDAVVLGGPLLSVGGAFMTAFEQAVQRGTLSGASAGTALRVSTLSSHDEAMGACALALRSLEGAGL